MSSRRQLPMSPSRRMRKSSTPFVTPVLRSKPSRKVKKKDRKNTFLGGFVLSTNVTSSMAFSCFLMVELGKKQENRFFFKKGIYKHFSYNTPNDFFLKEKSWKKKQ